MPDPITHELPMRWADLDSLNHVNNVVHLDYAAESRALLAAEGVLDDRLTIRRMTAEFVRPLQFGREPVTVSSVIDGDTLTQEVGVGRDSARTVFARVVTELGPAQVLAESGPRLEPMPCRIRRSDLDSTGAVSPVKVFELFQESRIRFVAGLLEELAAGRFVVARVDVTFGAAIAWRAEPYAMRSWINRVGNSSLTVDSELSGETGVHAHGTTVLVGFDMETQASRRLADDERSRLERALSPEY